MSSTGWPESFTLNKDTISSVVTRVSPGAYALGTLNGDTFYVAYVGRSDGDLAQRLKFWVGRYTHFKAGYSESPRAAFIKECNLYHDFGEHELDNKVHPDRPENSSWKCPRCKIFG